jgi:type I restriction enzyme R subunit
MPGAWGTETEFEQTTLERLRALGYTHAIGAEIAEKHRTSESEVVFRTILLEHLTKRYSHLPAESVDEAVRVFARPDGVDTLRRNMAFHTMLRSGIELRVQRADGTRTVEHVYAVDWENPEDNVFLAVNQLPISGGNNRRPDILIYVNGLPLVLFELKNPYSIAPSEQEALNQIQHYTVDIPQVFEFNALCVVSDGISTRHGVWTATPEWYAPWKSIDGEHNEPGTTGTMKLLVEGLFPKERLLSYVRDFIAFEVANEKITKKAAKYHQFFAVRKAAAKAVEVHAAGGDRRLGLVWHTTGSGKSLSMAFLVSLLRRHPALENPSFVIQVDRTDLDDQLFDQFVALRGLVGDVKHAESVDALRDLLATSGGEVIFTTIEKFRLRTDQGEVSHPVLSNRSNIIVIADEAHRSQYGFLKGFARYLADALPNARRLGFTGTPVSFGGADTVEVFGDLIHTYDIRQSQEDKATVPIFYEPRQVKLHLSAADIDASLKGITDGMEETEQSELERRKSRWAALAAAAGTKERLEQLAGDLLAHFVDRTATLNGKAMVVCMTRANAVRLYDELKKLPDCPEVKVVMTGDLGKDPKAWSEAGHLTTKPQRDAIKKRMVDPDDPLKLVIVVDMWLTGTDIPCLHTLYVDKPMRGHTIIQAISRVNRVFRDKPAGLVVDYIGIGDELRDATNKYTGGGGRGEPAPDIGDAARPVFLKTLEEIRSLLPSGHEYGAWRGMTGTQVEDLYSLVYGVMAEEEIRRDDFLDAETRLTAAFLLVKHLDDCRRHADEVIFCQRVRNQLLKALPGRKKKAAAVEQAVRDLVDDSVGSEGVVDIFKAAGLPRADISVLDDSFLQTFKSRPHQNLRLMLLEQLLADEIRRRQPRNLVQAKSFRELLAKTLQRYHNRLIDAATVVAEMLRMKQEMDASDARAQALGLGEEEVAFYDAIAENSQSVYDEPFLRDLVHDVVQTIKRNLKVDWVEPHRDQVRAEIRAAVKRVLRKRGVRESDFEPFIARFMQQAEAQFADWPLVA